MIQNVDEEPEVERQEKIKKLKKQLQLLLEESEPQIYQFQQMTHYMTKQYCNYKFHQRMKNGIENIKTLMLMDLSAVIVIFGVYDYDEITKWQQSIIICIAALLAVFIPGIGYAVVYHKYKYLKNIDSLGYLLEYTNVGLDVGEERSFCVQMDIQKYGKWNLMMILK